LEKVNEILTKNTDVVYGGRIRFFEVKIEGSKHVPPSNEEVKKHLLNMYKWYSANKNKLHPFELATMIHAKLTWIHPFEDGNGRTSRAVMNWILMKNGLPMFFIPFEQREEYYMTLEEADKDNFKGKIVIDVTNPLVFLKDIPELDIAYPNSGGLKIQRMLRDSKVVKAFNTVTAKYMCNPKLEEGIPDLFIAGNDEEAKEIVKGFAEQFGWNVTDIGNIEQSYLLEALAMLWIRYGFLNNHWTHAFKLLKK
jgi:prophage maintenance system killer protein